MKKGGTVSVDNFHKIAKALNTSIPTFFENGSNSTKLSLKAVDALKDMGISTEEILSAFTTQELLAEIERRCGNE